MTPAARLSDLPLAERFRVVRRRLADRVGEITPERTGHWGPAWDSVAVPSGACLASWLEGNPPRVRLGRALRYSALELREWIRAGGTADGDGAEG